MKIEWKHWSEMTNEVTNTKKTFTRKTLRWSLHLFPLVKKEINAVVLYIFKIFETNIPQGTKAYLEPS